MLADFAVQKDVTDVCEPLTDEQLATVPGLLAQAMGRLRSDAREAGVDLDAVIWSDPIKMILAKTAVTNAVKRVLTNTDGATRRSFSIDDYREDVAYDDKTPGPKVIFIDPADLSGLIPRKRNRLGTIRLGAAL